MLDRDLAMLYGVATKVLMQAVKRNIKRFPVNAIPSGRNIKWPEIKSGIKKWCLENASFLKEPPPFSSPKGDCMEGQPSDVPFKIRLCRFAALGGHLVDGHFGVAQTSLPDIEEQRIKVIYAALETRASKLIKYHQMGFRTILILEDRDISLANPAVIGEAFVAASRQFGSELPDEVYVVEVVDNPIFVCPLKFNDTIFPDVIMQKKQE